MFIGILVPFMNNFGNKGFYNSQEIGLGKALERLGHKVSIYKLVDNKSDKYETEEIGNIRMSYFVAKSIGSNGFVNTKWLDSTLDVLICFSDMQLTVPRVFRWCQKNKVVFIPYIGATESHSPSKSMRFITNKLFIRNINIYKRCQCLAKNTYVKEKLLELGITHVSLAPVGLDLDLVNKDYGAADIQKIKNKYGFSNSDRVLLFIGRLEKEKQPIELIKYFSIISQRDESYKLLIIGKGSLKDQVIQEIKANKLDDKVVYIPEVANAVIWETYRICDAFVNLNKQEIFGMVLLEAMYYETKIVAWHAPGPDLIIENGISGFLVSNEEELYDSILSISVETRKNAHKRVVDSFTWNYSANVICSLLKNEKLGLG